jgi:hypothetical protein
MQFTICDGFDRQVFEAEDIDGAVSRYVKSAEKCERTYWVRLEIESEDGNILHTKVAVHPTEPVCRDGEHRWQLGAVEGRGGGVLTEETCRCGISRVTNTWDTDVDGEQGLTSIRYTIKPAYLDDWDF